MLRQSARAGTASDVWQISQRESWWRGIVNLTSSRWSGASELKEIAMTRFKDTERSPVLFRPSVPLRAGVQHLRNHHQPRSGLDRDRSFSGPGDGGLTKANDASRVANVTAATPAAGVS